MKILLRNRKGGDWNLMESDTYATEAELQHLLAESPGILTMDEIRPGAAPFVVAIREFGLKVGSIDILAFTAEGEIGIIECKLAANTQAKRQVIGQVMDYAAHLWEMSYELLDQKVREKTQSSLADLVAAAVDSPDWDEEEFRANVRTTLAQGNFILIIAVNEINEELSRILQFINTTGEQAYSFAALEMRRFKSAESEMLVPRVFGPARTAKSRQASAPGQQWDETTFFEEMRRRNGDAACNIAGQILEWANNRTMIWWGKGQRSGSFVPYVNPHGREHQLFVVWTSGSVEIYFYWYQYKPPFDTEEMRLELARRLNQIEGVNIPVSAINKRPNIPLETLAAPGVLEQFLQIFEWVIEEIEKVRAD